MGDYSQSIILWLAQVLAYIDICRQARRPSSRYLPREQIAPRATGAHLSIFSHLRHAEFYKILPRSFQKIQWYKLSLK